jgi:hypothetical protein
MEAMSLITETLDILTLICMIENITSFFFLCELYIPHGSDEHFQLTQVQYAS